MSIFISMLIFSFTLAITPGPINFTILSSGVNHGVRNTLPYMTGATSGIIALLLFNGLLFDRFVQAYPAFLSGVAIIGSLFIMYLGYRIATSKQDIDLELSYMPKFHHGFMLQWVNPISWLGCVSAASLFSAPDSLKPFLFFTCLYFFVCYLSQLVWAGLGDRLSVLLKCPIRLKVFNITMGGMLALMALFMCYEHFASGLSA